MDTFAERPLISVVMPTYETEPRYLREAIDSVRAQRYENWELCIVDDGSTRERTLRTIKRAVSRDHRITAKLLDENGGISRATNQGLALCRGELVAFLDHDDVLTADALLRAAEAFSADEIDVAYSDQDTITADGQTADTFLKPDWSPTYALGAMYIGHLLVARRELVDEVGGFDPDFDTHPGLRAPAAPFRADRADPPHPAHALPLAGDPGQHRARDLGEGRRARASGSRRQRPPAASRDRCGGGPPRDHPAPSPSAPGPEPAEAGGKRRDACA